MNRGQEKPVTPQRCPDPASSYERAKPQKESGMGELDIPSATPVDDPAREDQAVTNQTDPPELDDTDSVDSQPTDHDVRE